MAGITDPRRLLAARFRAQLLTGPPARSIADVAEQILAIQAQDPRGARLAVRIRSVGLSGRDVDAALNERSVVISTLNRGTLHLVRVEDYWWLHALLTPPLLTANRTRLRQEGVSTEAANRGVAAIEKALSREGPLTRAALRERVAAAGVPVAGQAFVHIALAATLRGLIVRGPMIGKQHAFVLVRDWLGAPEPVDRDKALAELARRYLIGHGPATDADLARWSGLPLGQARRGIAAVAAQLEELGDGLLSLRGAPPEEGFPEPRLCGAFEPILLGWTSRDAIVGSYKSLVTDNGLFRPFALVDGRAVATWGYAAKKVTLTPLEPIKPAAMKALNGEVTEVARFLG